MYLGDFHIHSTFSDGKLAIPDIVDMYGRQGFGAIAITDHLCESENWLGWGARWLGLTLTPATFPIYQRILASEAERAWTQYRMVVIPGIEITKNAVRAGDSAHILALGVTHWISADQPVKQVVAAIHNAGGIAIAAHPVRTQKIEKQTRYLWEHREALATQIDAWEVACGHVLFPDILHSNLPKLANSDFHRGAHMHSWKTAFTCERHAQAILRAIREQDLAFHYYGKVHACHSLPAYASGYGVLPPA